MGVGIGTWVGVEETSGASDELGRTGGAGELQIASLRPDGTPRPYVTIWVVHAGDDLYVRSAYGMDNPRFHQARASGEGRLRAGDPKPTLLVHTENEQFYAAYARSAAINVLVPRP